MSIRWFPVTAGLLLVAFLTEGCGNAAGTQSRTALTLIREPAASESVRFLGASDFALRGMTVEESQAQRKALLAALRPDEELWVIGRDGDALPPHRTAPQDDLPGTGALVGRLEGETVSVPIPLRHTDVSGSVSGFVASVRVTQRFVNPFDEKIEAIYVFPLPVDAAVSEFVMTIGERRIRGIVRERREAEQIYRDARAQGHVASLMTQERPNIFTQSVANIEPGKLIDIEVTYFNTLRHAGGEYELVFPMVVGPRFNPSCTTDGVGAVARGQTGSSGQQTEVSYLRPEERSGHDISLALDIDAGVSIETLDCPSHAVDVERPSPERATVRLGALDRIPNRDFVLRWRVAGNRIKAGMMAHRDERGGFFSLMLFPPDDLARLPRQPMEVVFVLDCSGSMSGEPLAKARHAIERALKRLREEDTFQIIRFSVAASQLGPQPLIATPANVGRGLAYLESLESNGGTMMIRGIRAALELPPDPLRQRVVAFMTDGFIGNELEIFAEVQGKIGDARIFSFGVGSSVNRYLLDGLARLGRGAVAYVGLDESSARAVDLFFERISHPALTDIELEWEGATASDVYPRRVPDLLVGRPVILTGRLDGLEDGRPIRVRVRGRAGDGEREFTVDAGTAADRHPAIPVVWARQRIAVLMDSLAHPSTRESQDGIAEVTASIRHVALEHGLLSAFTAFVAVDSLTRTAGDHGVTVQVPVPVPHGVKYSTTVK